LIKFNSYYLSVIIIIFRKMKEYPNSKITKQKAESECQGQ